MPIRTSPIRIDRLGWAWPEVPGPPPDRNRDARSLGTTGTIVGGVGLAAAAAAVVIYLTAPAASPVAEHARLELLPRSGGIMTWTARF